MPLGNDELMDEDPETELDLGGEEGGDEDLEDL